MSEHDELRELVAIYALDALDDADRDRVLDHLAAGCEECEVGLREARAVSDRLGAEVTPEAPSERVRQELFQRVRGGAAASRSRRSPRTRVTSSTLAIAASLLFAAGIGGYSLRLRSSLDDARSALQIAEVHSERERAQLAERVAAFGAVLSSVTAVDTRTVALTGQGPIPEGVARAFVDPEQRRVLLYVYELPPPPPGQTYQLWVIVDGKPFDAGIFGLDAEGRARHTAVDLPEIGEAAVVAVTLEPAGGVPQPTGPIVLAGS